MSAAQRSASQDVGWLAEGQNYPAHPTICCRPHWGTTNQGADFFQCDKNKLLPTAFTAWLMLKIFPQINYISHLWPASARPAAPCDSAVQLCTSPHLEGHIHPSQPSLILDTFEGISTHAYCETTPQTEPLHKRYLVPQPKHQYPQTPCSCLCLTTTPSALFAGGNKQRSRGRCWCIIPS